MRPHAISNPATSGLCEEETDAFTDWASRRAGRSNRKRGLFAHHCQCPGVPDGTRRRRLLYFRLFSRALGNHARRRPDTVVLSARRRDHSTSAWPVADLSDASHGNVYAQWLAAHRREYALSLDFRG